MRYKGPAPLSTIILVGIATTALATGYGVFDLLQTAKKEAAISQERKEQRKRELETIYKTRPFSTNENAFDTSSWKIYRNQLYGFQIKYPSDWSFPTITKPAGPENNYIAKISFRKNGPDKAIVSQYESTNWKNYENSTYGLKVKYPKSLTSKETPRMSLRNQPKKDLDKDPITPIEKTKGFDIYVYRNNILKDAKTENKTSYFEEVNFEKGTLDYRENYYYKMRDNEYALKIIPVLKNNLNILAENQKEKVILEIPEFIPIISTFGFQKEPATTAIVPKKKTVIGKISCPKNNDHPRNSPNKGKHMDEDCCPDPDEWPKPGCVYSPGGLALMLSGPPGKKTAKK